MREIPYDIWALIASFIPNPDLQKISGVNRAFFDVAINEHYRELSLEGWRIPRHLLADLENLIDPALAQRVRRIRIDITFLGTLLHQLNGEEVSAKIRWRKKLRSIMPRRRIVVDQEDVSHKRKLADLLLGMSNVTELSIQYQYGQGELPECTLSILQLLSPALSPNLRKLTITCRAESFEALSSPFSNSFECLDELAILLKAPEYGVESQSYSTTMQRRVAPFICRTKSTLRSLKIDCADPMDLSVFFGGMGYFPHLTSFDFQVHIKKWNNDDAILMQPSTLIRFLELHSSTLEFLRLPPTHKLTTILAGRRALSKIALPNLNEVPVLALEIASPSIKIDLLVLKTIQPLLAWQQLHYLNLPNYALTFRELKLIVNTFADFSESGLRTLKIKLRLFTPEFIDILANKIPRLKCLSLDVPLGGFAARKRSANALAFSDQTNSSEGFLESIAGCQYKAWALSDLSVFTSELSTPKCHWDVMTSLAQCVPSLTSFMGNGHMNMDVSSA